MLQPSIRDDPVATHLEERLQQALAGRYALEGAIAQGGMGLVFRARDLRHPRRVAVKVLPPELATAVAAERFVREIRTHAALHHPHILGFIESGDADGLPFYIMPHVDGESLRDKLTREKRLPLAEAARIVREAADALDCAHGHGVVHRDVKPENVLLAEGRHVMIADFGLALAVIRATDDSLTRSSHVVGTVAYMSPEQASGGDIDGRADVYSLGCMLFEMLAGHPPFVADTAMAVLAQHLSAPPPRLSEAGTGVPPAVDRAVQRALQKDPARRYPTALALSEALDAAIAGRHDTRARPALVATGAVMALAVVALAFAPWTAPARARLTSLLPSALDSTHHLVALRAGAGAPEGADARLHEAVARWSGIEVADRDRVARMRSGRAGQPLDPASARDIARDIGAGRVVLASVERDGDSLRAAGELLDVATGARLHRAAIASGPSAAEWRAALERLADALLFRIPPDDARRRDTPRTASFAARSEYERGSRELQSWNLAAADSAFARASRHDREMAAAALALAQVRSWASDDPEGWRALAERAQANETQLSDRDRALAAALVHMAHRRYPEACALYAGLKRDAPRDFTATFGLGECTRRDLAIVADSRTPSGWRFRASRWQAMRSYREAFELLPSIHRAFQRLAYDRMRGVLLTSASARVDGRALPPDTTTFRAAPGWDGDSLVLVPWSIALEQASPGRVISTTAEEAVTRQREIFREIAESWRRMHPDDVVPREAVATALELAGDPRALDTLWAARRLAASPEETTRIGAQEVWLRVKFGLPDDTLALAAAGALADSLLATHSAPGSGLTPGTLETLAGLALLRGRPNLAAALARRAAPTAAGARGVTPPTVAAARALLAHASAGAPVESIRVLEARIERDVRALGVPQQQQGTLASLLGQAAGLAYPVQPLRLHGEITGRRNALVDAQGALARGDSARARALVNERRAMRAGRRPADQTLDVTYPFVWTLHALGDARGAIDWLDPVLGASRLYPPDVVNRLANAGALVRALALRAELAEATGDAAGARRWAAPVLVLWRDADASLHGVTTRMQALAARPPATGTAR